MRRRNTSMRILHVVHSLPPYEMAGTPILTWQLARAQAVDHDVHLFCRLDDPERQDGGTHDERREGCRVRFFNRHTVPWTPLSASYNDSDAERAFRTFITEVRPEVIHFQHILGLGVGLVRIAKEARVPVLFTLHDFWLQCPMGQRTCKTDDVICDPIDFGKCGPCVYGEGWKTEDPSEGGSRLSRLYHRAVRETPGVPARRPRAALTALRRRAGELVGGVTPESDDPFRERYATMREALASVDLVIGTSAFIRDQFVRGFELPDEQVLFLANGMDFSTVSPEPKTPSERLRFGFVGSLIPTKGVKVLLDAFLIAAEQSDAIELHVHGGPNRWTLAFASELEDQARASAHADRIHLHGPFDNTRIGAVHAGMDHLVVPSIWFENSPLVLNEAAMTGTPVVVSDRGGMAEFVRTTGWGRTFRLGDPKSLAEVMVELAESRDAPPREAPPIKPIERSARQVVEVYEALRAGSWVTPPLAQQLEGRGGILD